MALVGTSLDAASATGPGATISFDVPKTSCAMQISTTGSPSDVEVHLEATIDGVNFIITAKYDSDGTGGITNNGASVSAGADAAVFTALRANLITLSGGTSPTVTVTIAVA